MDNLKDASNVFLYNTLSALDFGIFTDSINNDSILFLKKEGLTLVRNTAATQHNAYVDITKSNSDPGALKMTLLELNGYCPCEDCDYEYGFNISEESKTPGVFNDRERRRYIPYTDKLDSVTCTSGQLDDTLVMEMEDSLIDQVNANYRNQKIGYRKVYHRAFRAYRISIPQEDLSGGNIDIDITINGTTTTITLNGTEMSDAGGTGHTNLINASAAVNTHVRAIAISATEFLLVGQANGDVFTVADGANVSGVVLTVEARYLGVVSTDPMIKVTVEYDSKWATLVKAWYYNFSAPTAINANAVQVIEDGVPVLANETTVDATMLTSLEAAVTNAYVTWNNTADVWYIAGMEDLGVESLKVKLASFSTCIYVTAATPYGTWPYLTSDDVFRVFANTPNMGKLISEVRSQQPLDTDFVKIHIETYEAGDVAQHGPSRRTTHLKRVDIYVPKSIIYDDHWTNGSWMDETEAAADRHFIELLEEWSGTTLPVF